MWSLSAWSLRLCDWIMVMAVSSQNKTSHLGFPRWPGSLEPVVRRARRPLASPVGETWTCATASPTFRSGGGAVAVNAHRLPRDSKAPARISPDGLIQEFHRGYCKDESNRPGCPTGPVPLATKHPSGDVPKRCGEDDRSQLPHRTSAAKASAWRTTVRIAASSRSGG